MIAARALRIFKEESKSKIFWKVIFLRQSKSVRVGISGAAWHSIRKSTIDRETTIYRRFRPKAGETVQEKAGSYYGTQFLFSEQKPKMVPQGGACAMFFTSKD